MTEEAIHSNEGDSSHDFHFHLPLHHVTSYSGNTWVISDLWKDLLIVKDTKKEADVKIAMEPSTLLVLGGLGGRG